MKYNGIYGDAFFFDGPPFVKTNFAGWVEHADLTPDTAGDQDVGGALAHVDGSPGQGVEVFPN